MREPDQKLDQLAHSVIGAAIEVHRELGPGFLEHLYEKALCIELTTCEISFARQVAIPMRYKGEEIGEGRIDLVVDGSLVIELKAADSLLPIHTAQVLSYLRATGLTLGLLINFNVPLLKDGVKRIILSSNR